MDTREKTISKTLAYRGSILNLRIDKVEIPGGRKTVREVVEHSPAVAVLPVEADGTVYLIRQYRYAIGDVILEIPAGLVERKGTSNGAPSGSSRRDRLLGNAAGDLPDVKFSGLLHGDARPVPRL